jgi:hypothetical protein
MNKQEGMQQETSRPTWHQTLYAYHEAGHAVVGHVPGRCLSEVSLHASQAKGYKGYGAFDEFAERWQGLLQWSTASQNPERMTVLYAGTVAMRLICEQRGWQYARWRGCDQGDFDQIYLRSLEMSADEEEQQAMQRGCRKQAQAIIEEHWTAVEALAAVLATQGRVRGWEAHHLIQQAIDASIIDWRMEAHSSRELPPEDEPAF